MTCKNCYHYKVCSKNDKTTDYYGKEIACANVDDLCKYFKDKSRIIELPCKVGNEIYVLNRGNIPQKMILDEPDIRCHCPKEENLCMALCDDIKHNICAYRFKNDGSDIGEKVFCTKEKAEAKLKELEK